MSSEPTIASKKRALFGSEADAHFFTTSLHQTSESSSKLPYVGSVAVVF